MFTDSSSGRVGILEFRAFDMPPHNNELIAICWSADWSQGFGKNTYKHPLIRWARNWMINLALGIMFMKDIREVVSDLMKQDILSRWVGLMLISNSVFPHMAQSISGYWMEYCRDWTMACVEWRWAVSVPPYVDSSLEKSRWNWSYGTRYALLCNGIVCRWEKQRSKVNIMCIRFRRGSRPLPCIQQLM